MAILDSVRYLPITTLGGPWIRTWPRRLDEQHSGEPENLRSARDQESGMGLQDGLRGMDTGKCGDGESAKVPICDALRRIRRSIKIMAALEKQKTTKHDQKGKTALYNAVGRVHHVKRRLLWKGRDLFPAR